MEISWFGDRCIRVKGREGTVAADAYRSVVGPTGRGLTADIVTYSHAEAGEANGSGRAGGASGNGVAIVRPTSLEPAVALDGPGEYEIHDILVTGVRTFRDDAKGAQRGANVSFVYEIDGLHAAHLGDIGHLLTEEMLGEIGTVEVVCVPLGSALHPGRAAELVAQLDAKLVLPMPLAPETPEGRVELDRFVHEMGTQAPVAVPKLTVTISSVPNETTLVLLEARGRT